MQKMRLRFMLDNGRVVGDGLAPLHLRVDLEDGKLAKATLGIEQKGGGISWQLSVWPAALTWAADCVEEAITAAKMQQQESTRLQSNVVDPGKGAT